MNGEALKLTRSLGDDDEVGLALEIPIEVEVHMVGRYTPSVRVAWDPAQGAWDPAASCWVDLSEDEEAEVEDLVRERQREEQGSAECAAEDAAESADEGWR